MNSKTEEYIRSLMKSELLAKADQQAEHFYGRQDARERVAEYLQNICPAVFCIQISTANCVKNEERCGINFSEVAEYLLARQEETGMK